MLNEVDIINFNYRNVKSSSVKQVYDKLQILHQGGRAPCKYSYTTKNNGTNNVEYNDKTCKQSHTGMHTSRQAGSQADRQADGQAGRQADRQVGRQAGRQTDRQACNVCMPSVSDDFLTLVYPSTTSHLVKLRVTTINTQINRNVSRSRESATLTSHLDKFKNRLLNRKTSSQLHGAEKLVVLRKS